MGLNVPAIYRFKNRYAWIRARLGKQHTFNVKQQLFLYRRVSQKYVLVVLSLLHKRNRIHNQAKHY